MSLIVAFTMGLAIWHFSVFVPEHEYRFWGGIVGALLASAAGAMVAGAIFWLGTSRTVGDTDIVSAIVAVPGAVLGLAVAYVIGMRAERAALPPDA